MVIAMTPATVLKTALEITQILATGKVKALAILIKIVMVMSGDCRHMSGVQKRR